MVEFPSEEDDRREAAREVHGGRSGWNWQVRDLWCLLIPLLGTVSASQPSSSAPTIQEPTTLARSQVGRRLSGLPFAFIENRGQSHPAVAYYLQRPDFQAFFATSGVTLRLKAGQGEEEWAYGLKMEMVGAAPKITIESIGGSGAVVSYFKGPCEQWEAGIPTTPEIAYRQPWPGVDVRYRGQDGNLEALYVVAPGADPSAIRLRYLGHDRLKLDEAGNLSIETPMGKVEERAPVMYQEIAGQRVRVDGGFFLVGTDTVGFQVAEYDHHSVLMIDPTLAYAGYVGGSGNDIGTAIAVDSTGAAYVTGWTTSAAAEFPVAAGPALTQTGGDWDVFVAKVNPRGTGLVYLDYFGGSGYDRVTGIAVDHNGAAYVTGFTYSMADTFPITVGPDLTFNGVSDAFVAKVNPSGTALEYCGYIGGSSGESGSGIAVDNTGAAYIAGSTYSTEATFPVTVGPDLTCGGYGFVAKVDPSGSSLVYAGYVDGTAWAGGIAVDAARAAYVTGATSPMGTFPATVGPDLTYNGGPTDAFVAKVDPSGAALVYAGYIGGSSDDTGTTIAVDNAGAAYVTGYTESSEATFPVTVGPSLTYHGSFAGFVAKVSSSGTDLLYAGYLGVGGSDPARGIAVDGSGAAYILVQSNPTAVGFPAILGSHLASGADAIGTYVAKVDPTGTALVYTIHIAGSNPANGLGIAVDSTGAAYVAGQTSSTPATFPARVGPDLTYNGGGDAFVAKIVEGGPKITMVVSKTSKPGSTATLRGTGFSKDKKKNVVYFGTPKAKVSKATSTLLRVIIPKKCPTGDVGVYVVIDGATSNVAAFTVK